VRSFANRPTAEAVPDVIIIGAGVIGCSIAYHLSLAGSRVFVLEREHLAAGASGVAAGMLAPQVEAPFDDSFFALTLLGRSEHFPLAQSLLDDVGLDVECRATGILRVARDEAERVELQRRFRWQTARGLRAEWLEPNHLGDCEPLMAGVVGRLLAGGLWLPDEGQVRSPRLVQALAAASVKRGGRFLEGTWATAFETKGSRIVGVRTPVGTLQADVVVLAAGVWSNDLARTAGLDVPVGPVKGQIVTLRALNRVPRHVVWTGECYVVPKDDGQVILGATEEDGNYDRRPTLAGVGALAEAALEFLPWAGQFTVEGMWAGLRPAAPDRYPIVGRAPGYVNLILATAHYRNGVLLGPLTGRWVTDLIRTGTLAPELAPFTPERFTGESRGPSPEAPTDAER
jgi:glycine oxidase